MLWTAMLRGTSVGLLAAASLSAGARVVSSKDTPVPSGTMPWFVVYVDDESTGIGGGPPQFKTTGTVTVEARAEVPVRMVDKVDQGRRDAERLLSTLIELVKKTLLGAQGFAATIAVTNGSAVAIPEDPAGISEGMLLRGPGINPNGDFVAVDTVNDDGSLTLSEAFAGDTGSYRFNVGSFVHLFEEITKLKVFTDYRGAENKNHVAFATIEISGTVTEIFQPAIGEPLNGITVYVDSVNIFDRSGDYTGDTPFNVAPPAPRTTGPDGRPESTVTIDTSS
jgi:hypothetical protein